MPQRHHPPFSGRHNKPSVAPQWNSTVSHVSAGLNAGCWTGLRGLGKRSRNVPRGSPLWWSAMTGGSASRFWEGEAQSGPSLREGLGNHSVDGTVGYHLMRRSKWHFGLC